MLNFFSISVQFSWSNFSENSLQTREYLSPRKNCKVNVADSGEGVCVDPGEKGAILENGGSALQKRERGSSWLQTAEERGRSNMVTGAGDGLATASREVYAQSECIVHCTAVV
jgi:hypothetical protein